MRSNIIIPIISLTITTWFGCAANLPSPMAPSSPIIEIYSKTKAVSQNQPPVTGDITLAGALSAALERNPRLSAYSWQLRAADAKTLQLGLYYNPEVELEMEEFAGSKTRTGLSSALTTLRLSQAIDLSGVVSKRQAVAAYDARLLGWDYEMARLEVFASTTLAFIDVAAAQQRLELTRQNLRLANEVAAAVDARVKAGKVSPLNLTKIGVLVARSQLQVQRAANELDTSRTRLAAKWGDGKATFRKVIAKFMAPGKLPSFGNLSKAATTAPEVVAGQAKIKRQRMLLELQRAKAVPALKLSAGVQRFETNGEFAAVAGLGIELPLFDRNQGSIEQARMMIKATEETKRAALLKVQSSLAESYRRLQMAFEAIRTFDEQVLPSASQVFNATKEAYSSGKLGILDLLDAQRTLVIVRMQRITALAAYYKQIAKIEARLGRPIGARKKDTEERP